MPKAKKKFINKKQAITFNLVHRSQRDPLIADESAPQRVLVPVNANVPSKKDKESDLTPEQRKEEQHKYGIYFDDDYNYLQHLKDTREVTMVVQPKPMHKRKEKTTQNNEEAKEITDTITLPSSVFASEIEEDVGLLNKAATQGLCLDLDPEVVAALDEDFDYNDPENELEDNFIDLAMGSDDEEDIEEKDGDDDDEVSDDDDSDRAVVSDLDSDDDSQSQQNSKYHNRMPIWEESDRKSQAKSRFTQYSMSSSVIRRNQGLTLLDDRFEKMFAEYDDTELGALDLEEIEGHMPETHPMLVKAVEDFELSKKKHQLDRDEEITRINHLRDIAEESEEEMVTMEIQSEPKWDCKSIISTYSNKYNHPKLIEGPPKEPTKIKINQRTGIPKDTLGKDNKLTARALAKFNAMSIGDTGSSECDEMSEAKSVMSVLSVLSIRPNGETPEQRKERKQLLKEYRRERRKEKKDNKEFFKELKKVKDRSGLARNSNIQGVKIF